MQTLSCGFPSRWTKGGQVVMCVCVLCCEVQFTLLDLQDGRNVYFE